MAKSNPLAEGLKVTSSPRLVEVPPTQEAPAATSRVVKTRIGTKMVGCHLPADAARTLRMIAAENDTTVQELLAEAIDTIFAKYNKPQIAKRELQYPNGRM